MDILDTWGRKIPITSPSSPTPPFFSNPSDSHILFTSPSLCPPILFPIPHLTPERFLTVSNIPPSVSSTIDSSLHIPNPHDDAARILSYNRLQFLIHDKNSIIVFFPTGTNLDQLGFIILSIKDSCPEPVKGDVYVARERLYSKILKILVQPVSNLSYVMVCSMYSVHWYSIKSQGKPVLNYLGLKQFKNCSVVSAAWSPHLSSECLVLLEKGDVFVFDLNQRECTFRGCKLKVCWDGYGKSNRSWLGCEFGWRIGMFIVARSDSVFVVTRSSGDCNVRSLLEIESLNNEEIVTFSKCGEDSFRFILASKSYLYLCDQRSVVPLLKWQHDVDKPCFIDVYSLTDIGYHQTDDESSISTKCVVVGSFWNAQSQMFCYKPFSKDDPSSLYAWKLPHNLLSPAGKCLCGDCVFRDILTKESLPEWIDWQKKSNLVLGYGVLNKYIPLDQSSGFTLIRLTSLGNLEAVEFHASNEPLKSVESTSEESDEVTNLLYLPDEEFKFPKRFKYLELEYLSAHAKGNLVGFLESKMSDYNNRSSNLKKSFSSNCHEEICEKLKLCGFGRDRCSSAITAVFESINSPTSVYDVALRETWSSLPIEILMLAFSNYSEFEDCLVDKKKPSLEFLVVPELPQLPPFFLRKPSSRSSKWSKKEQPNGVELVGPVVPLPVLLTLHELRNGCVNSEEEYSPDVEFSNRCKQISKTVREIAKSGVVEETIIPLDEDMFLGNDSQMEKRRFIAYSPMTDSDKQDQELGRFVSKVRKVNGDELVIEERAGLELFDDMSPVEICFEDRKVDCDTKAMLTSKTLLTQWQDKSSSYQEFLSQYHLKK